METLLTLLGLVMVIEGIPLFTMPDRAREVARTMSEMNPRVMRIVGGGLMAVGLVVVAVIRLGVYAR